MYCWEPLTCENHISVNKKTSIVRFSNQSSNREIIQEGSLLEVCDRRKVSGVSKATISASGVQEIKSCTKWKYTSKVQAAYL